MAVKFSQFTVGSQVSDIDYVVGYKSTANVQIPIGLVTANTTYSIATAQAGSNETITLTGSDSSTDSITLTAGSNITLTDDGAGNGFTIAATAAGVSSITATAPINATASTGAITLSLNDLGVTTAKLADNDVTFAKLENRYTVLSALGSGTTFALDFSAATTFTAAASGAATFNFSNAVQGQVVDLILSGNFTITFAETGSTFNRVGSVEYDGTTNNILQIICTDDSTGAKVYHYSVATYQSDSTPG
jgi:hypothetical protein